MAVPQVDVPSPARKKKTGIHSGALGFGARLEGAASGCPKEAVGHRRRPRIDAAPMAQVRMRMLCPWILGKGPIRPSRQAFGLWRWGPPDA